MEFEKFIQETKKGWSLPFEFDDIETVGFCGERPWGRYTILYRSDGKGHYPFITPTLHVESLKKYCIQRGIKIKRENINIIHQPVPQEYWEAA